MRFPVAALLLVAAFGLPGCRNPAVRTDLPTGYVPVRARGDSILTAVSAKGNRIDVRRHDSPPEGDLEFWKEAVRNELVAGRGYEIAESSAVTGQGGRSGWEYLFRVSRPDGAYLYLLEIRVERGSVITAEAGGTEAAMQPDLPELRRVLR
jgi:hypothetical protein